MKGKEIRCGIKKKKAKIYKDDIAKKHKTKRN